MTAGAYSLLAVVLYHTGDFNQVCCYPFVLVFLEHVWHSDTKIDSFLYQSLSVNQHSLRYWFICSTCIFLLFKAYKNSSCIQYERASCFAFSYKCIIDDQLFVITGNNLSAKGFGYQRERIRAWPSRHHEELWGSCCVLLQTSTYGAGSQVCFFLLVHTLLSLYKMSQTL